MDSYTAEINSIFFTSKGKMYCRELSKEQYDLIILENIEAANVDVLEHIYNKLTELYSMELLNRNALVLRFNYNNYDTINKMSKILELLNKEGFSKAEFIVDNLTQDFFIDSMLNEQKATLRLELDCGKTLDTTSQKRLKSILDNIQDKKKY